MSELNKITAKNDPSVLANALIDGMADEDQRGMILRTIQTTLGVSLLDNLESTRKSMAALDTLAARCVEKAARKMNEMLEADTIDYTTMLEVATTLQKNQIAYMELQRKIVQSPNKLFGEDLLSNEEKKILMLFKSFKTQKDKEAFIKAVDAAMKEANSFDDKLE